MENKESHNMKKKKRERAGIPFLSLVPISILRTFFIALFRKPSSTACGGGHSLTSDERDVAYADEYSDDGEWADGGGEGLIPFSLSPSPSPAPSPDPVTEDIFSLISSIVGM